MRHPFESRLTRAVDEAPALSSGADRFLADDA